MTTYVDPFGGQTIQPSEVGYRALVLSSVLTLLTWPGYAQTNAEYVAKNTEFTTTVASAVVRMPDAQAVSVGQGVMFTNSGANAVSLQTATGVAIVTIAPGAVRYVYLKDNSTQSGVWGSVLYGVGTSALDAGALSGAGLEANGSTLQVDLPSATLSSSFTVDATFRADSLVWTGGSGVGTLPLTVTFGNGFAFFIRNQGTGALTFNCDASEFVDGSTSISLQPQESALVVAGVGNWYTFGRGRNAQFSFTLLTKPLTGGAVTLTPTEASNVVQKYTGVLASNSIITVPSVVQVYYVSNQTSGAFTLTLRTSGVGTQVSIPSGQNAVLFCDGLNIINTSTTVSGLSSIILNAGSVSAPSIAISGDTSTGIYQAVSGSISITGVGGEVLRSIGVASGANYLQITNAVAGAGPSVVAAGASADISISLTPKGTGGLVIPSGAVGTPSVRVSGSLSTGLYSPAANQLAVTANGAQVALFSSSGIAGALNGAIGATTPSTGVFTTLSASGAVSGAGITNLFASPPAIGGTTPAAINTNLLTINAAQPVAVANATTAANVAGWRMSNIGNVRWDIWKDGTVESGSNAGSNFQINAYNDAGGFLVSPIVITRATGLVTLSSLTVSNATTLTGVATFSADPAGRILSGSWTPSYTNISNTTSFATLAGKYIRIGNHVNFSARFTLALSVVGAGVFTLSLPIASNFTSATADVAGSCAGNTNVAAAQLSGTVSANIAADTLEVQYTCNNNATMVLCVVGIYEIK